MQNNWHKAWDVVSGTQVAVAMIIIIARLLGARVGSPVTRALSAAARHVPFRLQNASTLDASLTLGDARTGHPSAGRPGA